MLLHFSYTRTHWLGWKDPDIGHKFSRICAQVHLASLQRTPGRSTDLWSRNMVVLTMIHLIRGVWPMIEPYWLLYPPRLLCRCDEGEHDDECGRDRPG